MTRIYTTTFAETGDKETLAATDPGTGKVSLPSGWTPDYEKLDSDPSYRPVGRKEMNGVLNEVTAAIGELQQSGFANWQALTGGWPLNARVVSAGIVYKSTTAANTATPPAAPWVLDQALPIATTGEAQAGTDNTKSITPLRMREGLNAAGSAPVYAARVKLLYTKSGATITILKSGNVSSVTGAGTGIVDVNFATALEDSNYVVSVSTSLTNINLEGHIAMAGARTSSSLRLYTGIPGTAGASAVTLTDPQGTSLVIF